METKISQEKLREILVSDLLEQNSLEELKSALLGTESNLTRAPSPGAANQLTERIADLKLAIQTKNAEK